MTDHQQTEDEAESAKVAAVAKSLGENFDAVVILCTRHEGSRGTRTVCKGAGNWHAQFGVVREWLLDVDESIREDRRQIARGTGL